ncbi:MAG TPA: DUF4337 family protein [Opitutaceae bacterium]|nr:DUF4337 family protein [Opitutaceae bacterium]
MSDAPEFKELDASIKHYREQAPAEHWTKYVSLSLIFLAVLAAYASQRSSLLASAVMRSLNEATFNQAEASDQWSYYQAKSIKQTVVQEEHDRLAAATPDAPRLRDIDSRIKRYDAEMQQVTKEAKAFEARRDGARAAAEAAAVKGQRMSVDSTIFQAAIAVGGVCLTVKKRWTWFVSLALGVLGLVVMAYLTLSK